MNLILHNIRQGVLLGNQSHTFGLVGKRGKGKSAIGLRICEMMSDRFSLDNVCFTSKTFLKLLNSGNLKKGDAVLFDEISVTQYARDFMSQQNKVLNHVLTTWRSKNLFLCYTCPTLGMLDKNVRSLTDSIIEAISINRKDNTNICKFKKVRVNPLTGKIMYVFPRVKGKHHLAKPKVKQMIFNKSKFLDEYDDIRKEYADELSIKLEQELLGEIEKQAKKKLTDKDIVRIAKKEKLDINNTNLIAGRFGIGRARCYRIKEIHNM